MTDIVRRTEYFFEGDILFLCYVVNLRILILQGSIFRRQEYLTGRNGVFSKHTLCDGDVRLPHEHLLLCCGELAVIPVVDDIVETVFYITDDNLLAIFNLGIGITIRIVGIVVGLHIQQRQFTMRC